MVKWEDTFSMKQMVRWVYDRISRQKIESHGDYSYAHHNIRTLPFTFGARHPAVVFLLSIVHAWERESYELGDSVDTGISVIVVDRKVEKLSSFFDHDGRVVLIESEFSVWLPFLCDFVLRNENLSVSSVHDNTDEGYVLNEYFDGLLNDRVVKQVSYLKPKKR